MPIIPKDREVWFLLLFIGQFTISLIWVSGQIPADKTGLPSKIIYVGQEMAPLAFVITAVSIVLVEGVPMLYEAFAKKREAKGREEGREEGREKGREEERERIRERVTKALSELDGQLDDETKAKLRAIAED